MRGWLLLAALVGTAALFFAPWSLTVGARTVVNAFDPHDLRWYAEGIGTRDYSDGSCQNFRMRRFLTLTVVEDVDDPSCRATFRPKR